MVFVFMSPEPSRYYSPSHIQGKQDHMLFCKMIEKTKLNEAEAKVHFHQIVSAIKTEDIPVSSSRIKVTDLGSATAFNPT